MATNAQPALLFGRWTFPQIAGALFLATFCLNVFLIGNLPLLKADEARFSEASREMRANGDWVVPHFNGQYRFDKPPLTYWCQMAAMTVFGENEFAARLHSVLAGALLTVVIFGFGTRMFHPEAGFWAAIIFTTSLRVMIQAKGATADMLLTLFTTLAFWAGWELTQKHRTSNIQHSTSNWPRTADDGPSRFRNPQSAIRTLWWWLFYISLALAFLAKGPVGWLPLLGLPLFARWTKTRKLNEYFRFELGLPLMLGLAALWAVPAYLRTDGEYWRVGIGGHVLKRMTVGYDGQGSGSIWLYLLQSPYYFGLVFFSMSGWSFWFPWCGKRLYAEKFGGANEKYLLAGAFVIFAVFTLSWSRLPHYTLPAFPLIALLLAGLWWRFGRSRRVFVWMLTTMIACSLILTAFAAWILPRVIPGRELARQCAPFLRTDSAFGAADLDQESLVWYFRHYVHDFRHLLTLEEAPAFMAQPGPRFCVMKRDDLLKKFPTLPDGWRRIDDPSSGYHSQTKEVFQLSVLIKP